VDATQCGFKGDAARRGLTLFRTARIGASRGTSRSCISPPKPVSWAEYGPLAQRAGVEVDPVRDSLNMLRDVVRIAARIGADATAAEDETSR